jgi:hypothetical protein
VEILGNTHIHIMYTFIYARTVFEKHISMSQGNAECVCSAGEMHCMVLNG